MRRLVMMAALILPFAATPARADLRINISKAQQRLSVMVDGREAYRWPVSTGRGRYVTPSGTYRPTRLERDWYSRKYDWAPMPWSVFFHRGYAVHGTTEVANLGRPASHGCVRLRPDNASILYNLVKRYGARNTKVVVMNGALPYMPRPRNEPVAKLAEAGDGEVSDLPKVVSALPLARPAQERVRQSEHLSAKAQHAPPPSAPVVKQAARVRTASVAQLSVSAGDEAKVMREREAWLRAIDRQFGVTR